MTKGNALQVDGAYQAAWHVVTKGGGTFAPYSFRSTDHATGYFVALGGYERKLPLTGCNTKDRRIVQEGIEAYAYAFFGYGKPGWARFVGTWIEGGELYLDITEHTSDLGLAINLAEQRNQLGFYDIANQQTIYV
jgi:hypothetical protein